VTVHTYEELTEELPEDELTALRRIDTARSGVSDETHLAFMLDWSDTRTNRAVDELHGRGLLERRPKLSNDAMARLVVTNPGKSSPDECEAEHALRALPLLVGLPGLEPGTS
jgi:hypothetical protein